jgi:hypothetical protein
MFQFFSDLLKAFQNANGGHKLLLVLLLIAGCAGVVCWERWTAGFRLGKLERSARILEQVSHVDGVDTNQVRTLSRHIATQLEDILGLQQVTVPTHSYAVRFGMGFIPWFILSLVFLPSVARQGKSEASAVFGAWAVGAIVAALCAFFPEGRWPWRHVLKYPIAVLVLAFLCGMVAAIGSATRTKIRQQQAEHPPAN